jgi:hypothetical protein
MDIFEIVRENKIDDLKEYIKSGADITIKDKEGKTALDYANEHGYTEIIDLLLERGKNRIYESIINALIEDTKNWRIEWELLFNYKYIHQIKIDGLHLYECELNIRDKELLIYTEDKKGYIEFKQNEYYNYNIDVLENEIINNSKKIIENKMLTYIIRNMEQEYLIHNREIDYRFVDNLKAYFEKLNLINNEYVINIINNYYNNLISPVWKEVITNLQHYYKYT